MKATLALSGTATYQLASALLVYNRSNSNWNQNHPATNPESAVTTHPILHDHRASPYLGPGRPLTLAGVEALVHALGGPTAAWLPPEVLSTSLGRVIWWQPAHRARIWFAGSDAKLNALNGKMVWHPALVFVAGARLLQVHALAVNERPRPETRLCVAPYWNLSAAGTMCIGSAQIPDRPAATHIAAFAQAFHESAFTHSNIPRLCAHPGGHQGLWIELAARKTAPDQAWWQRHLLRDTLTVNQLIIE